MSLNIKDPEAHRLAQAIAQATGQSMTRVVTEALRERHARIERRKGKASVAELLAIADKLVELKAVCACGRKATMNLRVDASGRAIRQGAQTEIGGNDRYVALCRRHFVEQMRG